MTHQQTESSGDTLTWFLFIPGKIPSLNELLDQRMRTAASARGSIKLRGQKSGIFNGYSVIKKEWTMRVKQAMPDGMPVAPTPGHFSYLVVEQTKRRDPSNFCSSALKLIEDGLFEVQVIPNDGWKDVQSISLHWKTGEVPGIVVSIGCRPATRRELENVANGKEATDDGV